MRGCELLVCIEPTRGVDVGAKVEIYRQLEGLARDGAGGARRLDRPAGDARPVRPCASCSGGAASQAELDPRTATEQDLLLAMQGGAEGEQRGLLEVAG